MPRRGYKMAARMRHRDKTKRGGNDRVADGLLREMGSLATYIAPYVEALQVRNLREPTIGGRRKELIHFMEWAEARGILRPEELTRSILESYQRYLYHYRKKNGHPLSFRSQYGRINSMKLFFSWLCKERVLEANPASEIELPRLPKRLPHDTPSAREVEAILSVPDITDLLGIRDRAILELFYTTGIRRGEMVKLELSDLNRDLRTLAIRQGKGNKDRVVPVGERAMRWVQKYLDDVRPLLLVRADELHLFITGYGEGFSADVLTRQVARYVIDAGIGRTKGSCHLFRHACATHMLEGGADIRYIQQLLGHSNLDATSIYTQVSIRQLQLIHAQTHPAEIAAKKN